MNTENLAAYGRYLNLLMGGQRLPAQHAGGSYPAEPDAVLGMVRDQFQSEFGEPPEAVKRENRMTPRGLVVPHLDFRVGGDVYPHAYRELLAAPSADIYLILGVGHQCSADFSLLNRGYETVLGNVEFDEQFARLLEAACPWNLQAQPLSHLGEHSIEFVVIYLQALARLKPDLAPFTIVPVLCGGMQEALHHGRHDGSVYAEFAEALAEALRQEKRRVVVIGSIDGCHVGPRFDHPYRVTPTKLHEIAAFDRSVWDAVKSGDLETFWNCFLPDGNPLYFDGVGVLYVMLSLFDREAVFELLKYEQWFEKKDHSVVTLASGVFRAEKT